MKLKGTFTSIWDGDTEITTDAELDTETGEVTCESIDVDDMDLECLEREFFTDEDDNEYRICTTCHEYILVDPIIEGERLPEVELVCSNPYCDSNCLPL